jgi:16S rRNA processing protein RimM
MVLVGRIARPHGLRGHVIVNPETDFADERFAPGSQLWVRTDRGDEELTIAASRNQNGRPVIALEGYSSVEDVERLAGLELRVPEAALPVLDDGTYYHHQLVGCVVETVAGTRVGAVLRVDGGTTGTLLVVNGTRGEILIPFAADICVAVSVEAGRITVDPPEGLLELNDR